MTAYAKDKITKENIEVPTQAEFESQNVVRGLNKLIFGNNASFRFFDNLTKSITLYAGDYGDVDFELTASEFPANKDFSDLLVFATMKEGEPLVLHAARLFQNTLEDNKWFIRIILGNITSATQSVTAKFDILLVDLNLNN